MNVLAAYLEKRGRGSASAVARRAEIQWRTVRDIAEGKVTPRVETARAIERATDGEVSAAALLGVSETVDTSAGNASPAEESAA